MGQRSREAFLTMKGSMTPAKERLEEKRRRTAIWRWYRLGGRYDKILDFADLFYATKTTSLPKKSKPDE